MTNATVRRVLALMGATAILQTAVVARAEAAPRTQTFRYVASADAWVYGMHLPEELGAGVSVRGLAQVVASSSRVRFTIDDIGALDREAVLVRVSGTRRDGRRFGKRECLPVRDAIVVGGLRPGTRFTIEVLAEARPEVRCSAIAVSGTIAVTDS